MEVARQEAIKMQEEREKELELYRLEREKKMEQARQAQEAARIEME